MHNKAIAADYERINKGAIGINEFFYIEDIVAAIKDPNKVMQEYYLTTFTAFLLV
jgi:hypothetical protein